MLVPHSRGASVGLLLSALLLVVGCAADESTPTSLPAGQAAEGPASLEPTPTEAPASPTVSDASADAAALAELGPHGVGIRRYEFMDPRRGDRPVAIQVWYPALAAPGEPALDAAPEPVEIPFPVVLGSGSIDDYLGEHLASHGFAFVAGIDQGTWYNHHPNAVMIDYPLDLMTALDGLSALEDDPLAGVLDTSNAGVADYSFGAWTALMLAGARVDPDHYRDSCADRPGAWTDHWRDYVCGTPAYWDEFIARGEAAGVASASGPWPAFGDERIRAVMPMMPEGFDLIGERGMATAQASALFVAGSRDVINDYVPAAIPLLEHYPAGGAALVTFVDAGHFLIFSEDGLAQIRRLATIFFDARLRANPTAASLLTEAWIERAAGTFEPHPSYLSLVWGAVDPSAGQGS